MSINLRFLVIDTNGSGLQFLQNIFAPEICKIGININAHDYLTLFDDSKNIDN